MAFKDRPKLLKSLSKVPTGRFNQKGVNGFVDQLAKELEALPFGGTIASTTNILVGDGAGNADDAGIAVSDIVQKQTSYPTPTNQREIIALLQAIGVCACILFVFAFSSTAAEFQDIPSALSIGAGESVRRNAGDSAFEAYTPSTFVEDHSVTFTVDGSGTLLTTGTKKPIKIVFGGTLQGWVMMCSPSGAVTADVYRAVDGAGLPVTSIVGAGTKPAISSDVENRSTSFTSWTSVTLAANDNLAVNLSGISTATYVTLTLYFK